MVEELHLEEIDWYGDTAFNRLQMPRFLAQWQAVVRHTETPEQLKLVSGIREFAERCQSEVHLYLQFIGGRLVPILSCLNLHSPRSPLILIFSPNEDSPRSIQSHCRRL
jgi:hypothetical protein